MRISRYIYREGNRIGSRPMTGVPEGFGRHAGFPRRLGAGRRLPSG